MRRHEERRQKLLARQEQRLAKGRETRRIKIEQRSIVQEKVARGMPITAEERVMLEYTGGRVTKEQKKEKILEAAASLVIKPQSVHALRLVVEQTAAKMKYNPIESLIELTQDDNVKESEKIAIHKALLPFLVPQLATPKPEKEEQNHGVKVTVTQFVFPKKDVAQPALHTEKPVTVNTDANK
jgi:hypothetical protein